MKCSIFQKTEEKRDKDLLIAATVIAAMAYQAALSPPGGIASVDAAQAPVPSHDGHDDLQPGASLLAFFYTDLSNVFWIANTISLVASLCVIFAYVSGLSLKRQIQVWLIRVAMWITLSSMTVAYVCAVLATTPINTSFGVLDDTFQALLFGVVAWLGFLFLCFLVLVFRFLRYIVRNIRKKNTTPVPSPAPAHMV